MEGLRIGVTGATGFLGSHTALELRERGATVIGVVRNPAKGAWLEAAGLELREADLSDPEALRRAFEGLDAVVSNATLPGGPHVTDVERFLEEARATIRNVVDAALAAGVPRMVHISSVSAYRSAWPWRTVRESDPLRERSSGDILSLATTRGYAASKAEGEKVVWQAIDRGLEPTVLRLGLIYGSRDTKLTQMYARRLHGAVRVVPTLQMPHVHARDVAAAVAGALLNPVSVGRAYNVTGPPHSLWSVARAARRALGRGPWLLPVPVPVRFRFDNEAAERDLGVRFRSVEDGMREAFRSDASR